MIISTMTTEYGPLIEAYLRDNDLDAVIYPTGAGGGTMTSIMASMGPHPIVHYFFSFFVQSLDIRHETHTDVSKATVPIGQLESGEPVGIYLIGKKGGEEIMLGICEYDLKHPNLADSVRPLDRSACERLIPPRPVPDMHKHEASV